jgi:large subunit ribosomal protein L13
MIIDAKDAIVGRLAAIAAKQLLLGNEVVVINAEQAVISGNPERIVAKYAKRRTMRSLSRPEKSPSQSWSRRPDMLLRRIMRGMLPKDSSRGRDALRKLRVFMGVPKEVEEGLKTRPAVKLPKQASGLMCGTTTLNELCKSLGWHA